jgi:hypothetical protein
MSYCQMPVHKIKEVLKEAKQFRGLIVCPPCYESLLLTPLPEPPKPKPILDTEGLFQKRKSPKSTEELKKELIETLTTELPQTMNDLVDKFELASGRIKHVLDTIQGLKKFKGSGAGNKPLYYYTLEVPAEIELVK